MIAVLRKDWRRLWPQALLFWILLALSAWFDPAYTNYPSSNRYQLVGTAVFFCCAALVLSAIHQEAIPGDRQYWLTRPIGRGALAGAKVAFIALAIVLPILAFQVAIYLALGLPLREHWRALLASQAGFLAWFIMPIAALACLTRTAREAVLVFVATATAVFLLGSAEIARFSIPVPLSALGHVLAFQVALAIGAVVVIWFQYARRARVPALAATALTGLLVTLAVHTAFPAMPKPPSLTLHLRTADQPAPPAPPMSLEFPVRFDGVPPGFDLAVRGVEIKLSVVGRPLPPYATTVDATLRREGDDRAWLTLLDGRSFFRDYLSANVQLHAEMSLYVFKPDASYPVPRVGGVTIPRFGRCESAGGEKPAFFCYSPAPRTSLALQWPGGASRWLVVADPSLPQPSQIGFQSISRYNVYNGVLSGVRLVTADSIERRDAFLDLDSVTLADFVPPSR